MPHRHRLAAVGGSSTPGSLKRSSTAQFPSLGYICAGSLLSVPSPMKFDSVALRHVWSRFHALMMNVVVPAITIKKNPSETEAFIRVKDAFV